MKHMKMRQPCWIPSFVIARSIDTPPSFTFIHLHSQPEWVEFFSAWDYKKNLTENQENLVKNFEAHCLNFSYQCLGNRDFSVPDNLKITNKKDNEKPIQCRYTAGQFKDDNNNIRSLNTYVEMLDSIHYVASQLLGQTVGDVLAVSIMQEANIASVSDAFRANIHNALMKVVETPIGCELLRILIAKCVANKYSKLVLMPNNNSPIFQVAPARPLQQMMFTVTQVDDPNAICFLVFGDEYPSKFVWRQDEQGVMGNELEEQLFTIDSVLFHELVHWLHLMEGDGIRRKKTKNTIETSIKSTTTNKEYTFTANDTTGNYTATLGEEQLAKWAQSMFEDDEEYRTTYGVCNELPWSGLCEGVYTLQRYYYITGVYWDSNRSISITAQKNGMGTMPLKNTTLLQVWVSSPCLNKDAIDFFSKLRNRVDLPQFNQGFLRHAGTAINL
jgi:hypothetical protein